MKKWLDVLKIIISVFIGFPISTSLADFFRWELLFSSMFSFGLSGFLVFVMSALIK